MNKPARPRTRLTPKLDMHLISYVAAATAAGVGLLSQTAEAKIVYTAANIPIPADGGYVQFDINNDGIPDFGFYNFAYPGRRHPEGFNQYSLTVAGSQSANQIWATVSNKAECAAILPKGAKVEAGRNFQKDAIMFFEAGSYTNGGGGACKWGAAHHGAFLGLKFVVNGETHYGWAHVTVGTATPVLNGYAYETIPNQPILTGSAIGPVSEESQRSALSVPAPAFASLGLLARGSLALAIWRRPDDLQQN